MSFPQFTNAAFTDFFFHWEKIKPNEVFLRQPKGSEWTTYTYKEVGEQARKLASFLEDKGVKKKYTRRNRFKKLCRMDYYRFSTTNVRCNFNSILCQLKLYRI